MEKAKIVKKTCAAETLKKIPVGEKRIISIRDIKFSSMRTATYLLKKKGYLFKLSEKGLIDEYIVTRLK